MAKVTTSLILYMSLLYLKFHAKFVDLQKKINFSWLLLFLSLRSRYKQVMKIGFVLFLQLKPPETVGVGET